MNSDLVALHNLDERVRAAAHTPARMPVQPDRSRRLRVVADPLSYLLCGTPRTGSTLLCGLLASTGVAGRPQSYFRQPDERACARRLGVPVAGDGSFDYPSFVRAARTAGSTPNGVFAARVMWGTMHRLVDGLAPAGGRRNLDVLVDAFGPLRLVYLRRDDVVGQAVSWARAEQTGCWQDGDRSLAQPRFDLDQTADLVRTIREHNAGWRSWFAEQGVEPHSVTYEDVIGNVARRSNGSSTISASSYPGTGDPLRGSAARPTRSTSTGPGATAQHSGRLTSRCRPDRPVHVPRRARDARL